MECPKKKFGRCERRSCCHQTTIRDHNSTKIPNYIELDFEEFLYNMVCLQLRVLSKSVSLPPAGSNGYSPPYDSYRSSTYINNHPGASNNNNRHHLRLQSHRARRNRSLEASLRFLSVRQSPESLREQQRRQRFLLTLRPHPRGSMQDS